MFKERVPAGGALNSLGSNLDAKERSSGRTRFGGSFPPPYIPAGGSRRGDIALAPKSFN